MPWYSAGTVAVTNNNPTVTGTGTSFSANVRVGDALRGPDGLWYEVTNVASATVISIKPNYQGTTTAAGSYAIAPMQGYVKDSADALRGFVNQYGAQLASLGAWSTAPTAADARTQLGLGPLAIWQPGGTVLLSGAGTKVAGDFSSSAPVVFQTSTVNGATYLPAVPNGSGADSAWTVYNNAARTGAWGALYATSTTIGISSNNAGGGYVPLDLGAGGSTRIRLQNNGTISLQTLAANPITGNTNGIVINTQGYIQARAPTTVMDIATTGANQLLNFWSGTANVGNITTNGSVTSYNTGSDYRLKQGIVDADAAAAWDNLDAYRIRSYAYKTDPDHLIRFGGIAHELAEANPDMVSGKKDGMVALGSLLEMRAVGIVLGDHDQVLARDVPEPEEGRWIETGSREFEVATSVPEPADLQPGQRWAKTEERMVMQGVDWSKVVPELLLNLQTAKRMILDLQREVAELHQAIAA